MQERRPIGAEIRLTSNVIKNFVDREMSKRFCLEVTGVECMTLALVFKSYPDEVVASDFMKRFGISKATVSQTLAGLTKKGFIKQRVSKTDRRVKHIGLTKKGLDVKLRFDESFKDINVAIEANLDEKEKEELYRLLDKIKGNCGYEERGHVCVKINR